MGTSCSRGRERRRRPLPGFQLGRSSQSSWHPAVKAPPVLMGQEFPERVLSPRQTRPVPGPRLHSAASRPQPKGAGRARAHWRSPPEPPLGAPAATEPRFQRGRAGLLRVVGLRPPPRRRPAPGGTRRPDPRPTARPGCHRGAPGGSLPRGILCLEGRAKNLLRKARFRGFVVQWSLKRPVHGKNGCELLGHGSGAHHYVPVHSFPGWRHRRRRAPAPEPPGSPSNGIGQAMRLPVASLAAPGRRGYACLCALREEVAEEQVLSRSRPRHHPIR